VEHKAEMGVLLLAVLFFPFVTHLKVRTLARVRGRDPDDVVGLVGRALARDGFSVTQVEASVQRRDVHVQSPDNPDFFDTELALSKGANAFRLRFVSPEGEAPRQVLVALTQDNLTDAQRAKMTVLTGTPLAWCALRIHTALTRAGLTPTWAESEGQAQSPTPLSALRKMVVALSPWH
jgi:hypothetical protein